MAIAPVAIMTLVNMVNTMTTIPSKLAPIEVAARTQNRVFILYIAVLVAGGLLTAALTVWLSRVTNRYNEVIKSDADARIAEAKDSAAKANERTAQLEAVAEELRQGNLKLSRDLETERTKRLALEKSMEPRSIDPESATAIIKALEPFRGQKVQLVWFIASPETINFASQIHRILLAAGWMVFPAPIQRHTDIPTGVHFATLNRQSERPAVVAFEEAFRTAIPDLRRSQNFGGVLPFAEFHGSDGSTAEASDITPDDVIDLWIGLKPTRSTSR